MLQAYFDLDENPFSVHPNPSFYCDLKCHDEALQTILYSVKNQDTLIKITGQIGLGKSMVAACLRNKLKQDYQVCEIRNPNMTTDSLLLSLVQQLPWIKIPTKDLGSDRKMDILEARLIHYSKNGHPVVLIIDEAQAMEDQLLETLRLLTNLEQNGRPLLQIVMFGQKELDIKLEHDKFKQLRQRICFSYEIRALTIPEVSVYINYRLSVAGIKGRQIFNHDALAVIAKYTQGVPRNINIIAHKAMLFACSAQSIGVNKDHVWQALQDHGIVSRFYWVHNWRYIILSALLLCNIWIAYRLVFVDHVVDGVISSKEEIRAGGTDVFV